jgi:hypothetical protein
MMKRIQTPVRRMTAGLVAAIVVGIAASPGFAQDATTSTDAATSSTTTTSTTTRTPRTEATPQMIEEAIQRSLARTEKLRTLGRPEQWGSEEPFTFNPNR